VLPFDAFYLYISLTVSSVLILGFWLS